MFHPSLWSSVFDITVFKLDWARELWKRRRCTSKRPELNLPETKDKERALMPSDWWMMLLHYVSWTSWFLHWTKQWFSLQMPLFFCMAVQQSIVLWGARWEECIFQLKHSLVGCCSKDPLTLPGCSLSTWPMHYISVSSSFFFALGFISMLHLQASLFCLTMEHGQQSIRSWAVTTLSRFSWVTATSPAPF
jgi:hypothetical protein